MKPTATSLVLWLSWVATLAAAAPPPRPVGRPELRGELLRRTRADQEARKAWINWVNDHGANGAVVTAKLSKEKRAEFETVLAKVRKVDEDNTKWLKGVVEKRGWPARSLVGSDGADAAWLLVQHADAEPKFQRKCLDLMAKLPKDEVSRPPQELPRGVTEPAAS